MFGLLKIAAILLAAVGLSQANGGLKTISEEATFDDIPTNLVNAAAPQTIQVPVPYKYLSFKPFDVKNVNGNPLSLIETPTSNNSIVNGILNDVSEGTPMISTNYTGSKVKSFDLKSLSLACIIGGEVDANVPEACSLEFTGYKATGSGTVNQTLSFAPVIGKNGRAPFASGSFSSGFKELKEVSFVVTEATATPATTVVFFDDIKYVVTLEG